MDELTVTSVRSSTQGINLSQAPAQPLPDAEESGFLKIFANTIHRRQFLKKHTAVPKKAQSRLREPHRRALTMAANNLDSFKIYLKAYSDAEYDKVGSYYHEDVSILLPDKQFVSGRINFLEHLRRTHTLFTETLSIRTIKLQGDRSFVVMDALFEAKQDAPPEAVGGKSFQKGEMAHFVV